MLFDTIWLNARLATFAGQAEDLGIVEGGAIASSDGRIAYVGRQDELPAGGMLPTGSIAPAAGSPPA